MEYFFVSFKKRGGNNFSHLFSFFDFLQMSGLTAPLKISKKYGIGGGQAWVYMSNSVSFGIGVIGETLVIKLKELPKKVLTRKQIMKKVLHLSRTKKTLLPFASKG
jgi:hypothetical protein